MGFSGYVSEKVKNSRNGQEKDTNKLSTKTKGERSDKHEKPVVMNTDKEWELVRPLIQISHTGRPQKDIRASQWHPVACTQRRAEAISGEIRSASDCVQLLLPLAGRWDPEKIFETLRGPGHWHES